MVTPPPSLYTLSLHDALPILQGCTNGSEQTISIFTFSWNSMTRVVPRYWLTISCSPPWPLTRLSVMPVIPARNNAAFTSRSEEHTSELHHLGISYAVFCLKKK